VTLDLPEDIHYRIDFLATWAILLKSYDQQSAISGRQELQPHAFNWNQLSVFVSAFPNSLSDGIASDVVRYELWRRQSCR
jgi:hypothetical protein